MYDLLSLEKKKHQSIMQYTPIFAKSADILFKEHCLWMHIHEAGIKIHCKSGQRSNKTHFEISHTAVNLKEKPRIRGIKHKIIQ